MARRGRRVFTVVALVALVAAAVAVGREAQRRKHLADATASDIRSQLDDLDPATRAMVRAELASDVVGRGRDKS